MSAYIVDENHIAYLVQAGASRALFRDHGSLSWVWNVDRMRGTYDRATLPSCDHTRAQEVGQMLWDENHASVSHRYPDDRQLPGPIDCDGFFSLHQPVFRDFDPVQVIKACDCYDYQSCEHDAWPASEAKAYIDALRATAWSSLPGYDDAEWGAPKHHSPRIRLIGGAV